MTSTAALRAERAAPRPALGVELDYRPSYLAAGIAGTLVFLLYLVTLSPSTAMWDTSEYIAAAYVLGIPHPPGNPFFMLIGNVFAHLPIAPNVAQRINTLAALCSAVSAGMWFLITERVLVSWLAERWQRVIGGAVATLIGATAYTVWNQSVVNEKVYTVSLVFFAIVSWLTVRWCDEPHGRKADRTLVLIAYLLGLGYANHPAGFLVGPAVAVAVIARRWQTVMRWRLLLAAVGALTLGLTPFIYEPIRAAHFPAINEGEPTACTDGFKLSCTFTELTRQRLMDNVNRVQYGKPDLFDRQAPFFEGQVGMYWLYFKWQWLRDAHDQHPGAQNALAVLFLLLGAAGGYVHWKRDPRSFWFYGPLIFSITLLLIFYMNFKFGASQAPSLGDSVPREVRDRDYFYLWSFSAWSVWAALGLVWVWETLAAMFGADAVRVGRETVEVPRRRSWMIASPVLALSLIPLFANFTQASRHGHTDTRDFASDLLQSIEPYGVLVTVGDNDTFPLWYAQEVEGIRKDVVVANTSLLNTDWYTRQLIRRPVYAYDPATGPAIYRSQTWTKPAGPPLKLTMPQADAVPLYQELAGPAVFAVPGTQLQATVDPKNLAHGVLERADFFVLQMIRDAFPQRPIYFSRTSANYGATLGLGEYLMTQGLARKLMTHVPTAGGDTVLVQGEGYMDVARSKALWNIYEAPGAIARRGDWVDKPSIGIPYLYVSGGVLLAQALDQNGDRQAADKVINQSGQVAKAVGMMDVFNEVVQARRAPQIPITVDSAATVRVPIGKGR